MDASPTAKVWILILVFALGTSVSSLVAGKYGSPDACRSAAKEAESQAYPPTMTATAVCIPGE